MTHSTQWGIRAASGLLLSGGADDPEKEMRVIARDLRNGVPLDDQTRLRLAALIDPDGKNPGKLAYGHRTGGRPRTLDQIGKEVTAYAIVEEVSQAKTKNGAVQRAMKETGLTRAQVYEVLRKYFAKRKFGPNNL